MKSIIFIATILACAYCMSGPEYGSYILITDTGAAEKMQALVDEEHLPMNRIYIAFIRPDMVYTQNSLDSTGLDKLGGDAQAGFSMLKKFVTSMRGKNIEVFLSLGGWDWSCNPYWYMQYSIGAYNPSPNFWKINKYGGGQTSNCNEANNWCYTCEPESETRTIDDFAIFATPSSQAQSYIKNKKWDAKFETMKPGSKVTDPVTGRTEPIPGNPKYVDQGTNPYHDFVTLANDLGCTGVDLDYEEIWYADFHKTGKGPWKNDQAIYKFAAIMYDIQLGIQAVNPTLLFSSAVTVQGADNGHWWGGNLKGQVVWVKSYFPELMGYLTGGINVMSYDLSDNPKYHECPADQKSNCPLNKQIAFYLGEFKQNIGGAVKIGYEIGQPAYPDVTDDKEHQLPLSSAEFELIQTNTQPQFHTGGFIWETFKKTSDIGNIDPTTVLNGICKTMGGPECDGQIPDIGTPSFLTQ